MTDTSAQPVTLTPYQPPADAVFQLVQDFTSPLETEYAEDASNLLRKDMWQVVSAFKFYLGETNLTNMDKDTWIYVPAGYLSDGASVPRLFWDFIPPWGPYGQAAVVHDLLCEYLTVFKGDGTPVKITRKHADNILKEAMIALNVPSATEWGIYMGVKSFTYVRERLKGPTGPTARVAKRAIENSYIPKLDIPAATTDTTANSPHERNTLCL